MTDKKVGPAEGVQPPVPPKDKPADAVGDAAKKPLKTVSDGAKKVSQGFWKTTFKAIYRKLNALGWRIRNTLSGWIYGPKLDAKTQERLAWRKTLLEGDHLPAQLGWTVVPDETPVYGYMRGDSEHTTRTLEVTLPGGQQETFTLLNDYHKDASRDVGHRHLVIANPATGKWSDVEIPWQRKVSAAIRELEQNSVHSPDMLKVLEFLRKLNSSADEPSVEAQALLRKMDADDPEVAELKGALGRVRDSLPTDSPNRDLFSILVSGTATTQRSSAMEEDISAAATVNALYRMLLTPFLGTAIKELDLAKWKLATAEGANMQEVKAEFDEVVTYLRRLEEGKEEVAPAALGRVYEQIADGHAKDVLQMLLEGQGRVAEEIKPKVEKALRVLHQTLFLALNRIPVPAYLAAGVANPSTDARQVFIRLNKDGTDFVIDGQMAIKFQATSGDIMGEVADDIRQKLHIRVDLESEEVHQRWDAISDQRVSFDPPGT